MRKHWKKREFQLINEWFRHNEENIENFFDAIERAIPKWFEINLLIQHKEKEQDYKEKTSNEDNQANDKLRSVLQSNTSTVHAESNTTHNINSRVR